MKCNECTQTRELTQGATTLRIGSVTPTDTAIFVYLERTGPARRVTRFSVTTDGSGNIDLELTAAQAEEFGQHHCIVVYATNTTATPGDPLTITLADTTTTATCYRLNFAAAYDSSDTRTNQANQTLKATA